MSEYDEFVDGNAKEVAPARISKAPRLPGMAKPAPKARRWALEKRDPGVLRTVGKTRQEWVAQGRLLGEEETERRGETGGEREQRIKRAMMYAAWEWDGKPAGQSDHYRHEFGLEPLAAFGDAPVRSGADFKDGKK